MLSFRLPFLIPNTSSICTILFQTSDTPLELEDDCVRRDVRLDDGEVADCADFKGDDITWGFLFPSGQSQIYIFFSFRKHLFNTGNH